MMFDVRLPFGENLKRFTTISGSGMLFEEPIQNIAKKMTSLSNFTKKPNESSNITMSESSPDTVDRPVRDGQWRSTGFH